MSSKQRRILFGSFLLGALFAGFLGGFAVSVLDVPPARSMGHLVRQLRQDDHFAFLLQQPDSGWNEGVPPGRRGHRGPSDAVALADDTEKGAPGTGAPDADDFEKLRAIGYLGAEEDAPLASGVLTYDRDRADGSRLLYTSGHGPIAVLMERDGTVLHTWERSFEEALPDVPVPDDRDSYHYFRKTWLYDNGDLLVIFEGQALMKLDRNSDVLWARHNHAHHDLHVAPSGNILVLTRDVHVKADYNAERPILEDFVSVLDPDGREIRRVSLLEAVRRSEYSGLLDYSPDWGDIMHNNTLRVLDGRMKDVSPAFAAGHAVVSFNTTNVIGVVDLEERRLTWAMAGLTDGNHDPRFLKNGNLLVFDNAGGEGGDHSRVLEVDPFTQEVVWSYDGDETNGFSSWCCGTSHRLSNGNTLITETSAGRAFEVTPGNEIVWEFVNPYRNTVEGAALIAYLPEVVPVPADQSLDWLAE